MRLRFCWAMATTLPKVMLRAASAQSIIVQSTWGARTDAKSTRMSAAKAAALDPVAMRIVIEVGAPSYTSGAQSWNGTDEILNPNPTRRRPTPMSNMGSRPAPAATALAILSRSVEPVAPKMSAMPYRKKPEAKAPRRKYFIEASPASMRSRKKPART